ncbi:hypothetical protein [Marinobacter sp. SS21]|uniref:hypothetical protein n=1 Tax=Marinobacter sp. SS21 TaxID=2979460 RepID=UPI00232E4EDF|nr:hypothetical protein [Marinobacter sp. SS21]MDC0660924.1 hypothetical protein [Marinobacter sp. SS21]
MEESLKAELEKHGGDDVTVSYADIAKIFPSDIPHPDSFEYKVIDEERLLSWAMAHSWKVEKVPNQAALKNSPPIRFTRIK